jgi:hypothetical protein
MSGIGHRLLWLGKGTLDQGGTPDPDGWPCTICIVGVLPVQHVQTTISVDSKTW